MVSIALSNSAQVIRISDLLKMELIQAPKQMFFYDLVFYTIGKSNRTFYDSNMSDYIVAAIYLLTHYTRKAKLSRGLVWKSFIWKYCLLRICIIITSIEEDFITNLSVTPAETVSSNNHGIFLFNCRSYQLYESLQIAFEGMQYSCFMIFPPSGILDSWTQGNFIL